MEFLSKEGLTHLWSKLKPKFESLNSSTMANTSEIAVQKARIDSLVSLPSGSTSGDAELMDIRVKADGTTAETAGNAVREQIDSVSDDISNLASKEVTVTYQVDSGKYINKTNGAYADNSEYVTAYSDDDDFIKIPDNCVRIIFHGIDLPGPLNKPGWATYGPYTETTQTARSRYVRGGEEHYIDVSENDKYFRVSSRATMTDQIFNHNVTEFKITYVFDDKSYLYSTCQQLFCEKFNGQHIFPGMFNRGSLEIYNTTPYTYRKRYDIEYRIMNEYPISVSDRSLFIIKDGFKVDQYRVEGNEVLSYVVNQTSSILLTPGNLYYLSIGRINESESEKADITEFVSAVYREDVSSVSDIETCMSVLEVGKAIKRNYIPSVFTIGSRTSNSRAYIHPEFKYRIASSKRIIVDRKTKFLIEPGFTVRANGINISTGEYNGTDANTDLLVLKPETAYHITIQRTNEDANEIADIAEFMKSVYYDDGYEYELPGNFINGSYDTGGKLHVEYPYMQRVSSLNYVDFEQNRTFKISDGFLINYVKNDKFGNRVNYRWGVSGSVVFEKGYSYFITIRRSEEIEETADIQTFMSAISEVLSSSESGSDGEHTYEPEYLDGSFINGSRDNSGNLQNGYSYRVTNEEPINLARGYEYLIDDGFAVNLVGIDPNTEEIKHQNGITTKVFLNPDRNYYLTIKRTVEDTSEVADIETFTHAVHTAIPLHTGKHLRILVFGHSYSADSWQYVPFILKKYGITCEIYLYYRGNDSINRLVEEWNDTSERGYDDFGLTHIRRMCHVDTRYSDSWDSSMGRVGYSPKMVLEMVNNPRTTVSKWDLITLQTAPTECYFIKSPGGNDPRKGYEPWVRKAINLINASYKDDYVLGWFCAYTRIKPYEGNVTLGYPAVTGEEFDNRIDCLRAAETIYKNEPFNMIIPAAAAVFNARTNSDLASTSVSDLGNLWYSDAVHLQNGIPCYIANLTVVQSIFDKFYPGLSVIGDQTRLTDEIISNWNGLMPSIHGNVKSNSEALYELAQKCAVLACEHPFDIVPIYNASDTTELNFEDTRERYWADSLIDTSNIDDGQIAEQSDDA